MSIKVVVSGSFKKNLKEIEEIIKKLKEAGAEILAPLSTKTDDPTKDFIILVSDDPKLSEFELEKNFMNSIYKSDALIIANTDGSIGRSVAAEMSLAKLQNIPVIIVKPITQVTEELDPLSQLFIKQIPIDLLSLEDISKERFEMIGIEEERKKKRILSKRRKEVLTRNVNTLLKSLKR